MTPDEQMRQDIRDIKLAVVGDPTIGVTGLVQRMAKVERKQARLELRAAVAMGVIAAVWEGIKFFYGK